MVPEIPKNPVSPLCRVLDPATTSTFQGIRAHGWIEILGPVRSTPLSYWPFSPLLAYAEKRSLWMLILAWLFLLCMWTNVVLITVASSVPEYNQIPKTDPCTIKSGTVGEGCAGPADLPPNRWGSLLPYIWMTSGACFLVIIMLLTFVTPLSSVNQPSYFQARGIYLAASGLSLLCIVAVGLSVTGGRR